MNILVRSCLILIVLTACSSSPKTLPPNTQALPSSTTKNTGSMNSDAYKSLAIEKYGQNVTYLYNDSKTCVLCVKTIKELSPKETYQNYTSFFLYDMKNDRVLLEENLENATVRWLNDNQLRVSIDPEIVKGNEEGNNESGYIYDIKSQQKINKDNLPKVN